MDRTSLYRAGGILALSTAVLYVAAHVVGSGAERRRPKASEFVPPGFAELESAILEIRRNWRPRDKERALERVRRRATSLEAAMMWVLTRPEHELFEPTVDLAVALPLAEARPMIAAVAATGPVARRPRALLAAEHLEPWSSEDLTTFLLEGSAPVKIAALEVCSARADRPVGAILELFAHAEGKVREAALEAMPTDPEPDILRSLMDLANSGRTGSDVALRALARAALTPELEAALIERLPDGSPEVQTAILDALKEKAGPPSNPQLLWELAISDAPADVRAKALSCLERTGTYDLDLVRMELAAMPPRVRYHAARCMLRSGDLEGIEVLLDLASRQDGSREAAFAARQLLEQISGRPMHQGIEAWRAWFYEQSSLPEAARTLPASPF